MSAVYLGLLFLRPDNLWMLHHHLMRMPFSYLGDLPCWRRVSCVLSMGLLIGMTPAQAQTSTAQNFKGTPHDEVQKSLTRRDWTNAMWQIDAYLEKQPRDPQMRFWRARLLQQLKRDDEAFDVYIQLAQDYPELPEVQNNLGVMLAAQGKMDEAQQAFIHALRNNPNYATAHENLGDVLLHLAKRSFLKAQETGGNAKPLGSKLTALQPVLQLTLSTP